MCLPLWSHDCLCSSHRCIPRRQSAITVCLLGALRTHLWACPLSDGLHLVKLVGHVPGSADPRKPDLELTLSCVS